jgi:hypothetical protein
MKVKESLYPDLFIEEREGRIYFINEKYDGLSLYEVTDYHFLYDCLSGNLPDKIYSKILEYADILKMLEASEGIDPIPVDENDLQLAK